MVIFGYDYFQIKHIIFAFYFSKKLQLQIGVEFQQTFSLHLLRSYVLILLICYIALITILKLNKA